MGNTIIKVGFCIAYDWELLKQSMPLVYPHTDMICLSIDQFRKGWNGVPYAFDEQDFRNWLNRIDTEKKIILHEGVFSDTKNTAIQNDNLQRAVMAEVMGHSGWHVQIDVDEYFLDFEGFKDYLLRLHPSPSGNEKPINICANLIPLIKKVSGGYLYVKNRPDTYETAPFATNVPVYNNARRNGHFDHISPFFVLHETWAREEEQLKKKLESWGHNNDFESRVGYFNLWKALDQFNYKYIRDFHPLVPGVWQELDLAPGKHINDLIQLLISNPLKKMNALYYAQKNNRVIQGLRQKLYTRRSG